MQDFFGDTVGEESRVRIGVEIGKRQYGNRVFAPFGHKYIIGCGFDFFLDFFGTAEQDREANCEQGGKNEIVGTLEFQVDGFGRVYRFGAYDAFGRDVVVPAEYQGHRETRGCSDEQVTQGRFRYSPGRK